MSNRRTVVSVTADTPADYGSAFDGWDSAVFDNVGGWDSDDPSKITVPAGIGFAKHTIGVRLTPYSDNNEQWDLYVGQGDSVDSASTFPGYPQDEATALGFVRTFSNKDLSHLSPYVKCVPGDYYRMFFGSSTGFIANVQPTYGRTFWEVEWFSEDSVNAAMIYFDSADNTPGDSADWEDQWNIVDFSKVAYDTIGATSDSAQNRQRLTVPQGVNFVKLWGQMRFFDFAPANTHLRLAIYKNGDSDPVERSAIWGSTQDSSDLGDSANPAIAALGVQMQVNSSGGSGRKVVHVQTPPIKTSPGDYFEMKAYGNSGVGIGSFVNGSTYLAMEAFDSA